ncbi:MAG TPA: ABC transporter permease [Acidimicrobiales bacterium]|nr:ABC transporter permease [Acidimicrobiales bacterium]
MWLAQKVVRLVVVLFAVSVLTFLLTSLLPGSPVNDILGPRASDPVLSARVRHDLHLNDTLPVRYEHWLGGVVRGNFGRAYNDNEKVTDIIRQRLPVTIELLLAAQLLSLAVAIPLALLSAYRAGSRLDRAITATSFGALSVPDFVIAIVLVFVLAVRAHWLPATGYTHLTDSVTGNLRSIALPTITLALPLSAVYTRLLRSDLIATLQEEYILMARAEGLPTRRILLRHALRPSSFSLLTVLGINTGALIGGAVIVEYLFALPGMGSRLVDAIGRREYIIVQGLVLVIAVAYVLANFLVDVLYGVLDPRVRHA